MKKQTKQEFIDLLEKVFSDADFDLGELQGHLSEKLNKYSKQTSPYLKALNQLSYYIDLYLEGNNELTSLESIYEFIKDTINILNTPLKELEDIEAAIQRQLELDEYHKELPLNLLQLMADTEMTSIISYVNEDEKGLYVCFQIPYFSKDDSIRGYDEHLVYLNGYPSEYDYVESLIEDYYEKVNKIREKADLIAAAKAKLTDKEKELLDL